jgi:hypothetical protein
MFTAWHMAVVDPVTGGVSNAANWFGKVEVGAVSGAYYSTTLAAPEADGKEAGSSIEDSQGHITTAVSDNKLAFWAFHNVWVYKIAGIEFSTETAEANTFEVGFCFQDVDMPKYGGNSLESGVTGWTA